MNPKPAITHSRVFGPDLIRATAITLVLLAHTFPGGTKFPHFGVLRHFWGVLGVELFFLLSGYLIGGILMTELFAGELERPGGVLVFWKRRWFRTLPNYYLFLLLYVLEGMALHQGGPDGLGRFLWFGQALMWPDPDFFTLSWSLAIEEWFYLLFPLLLFVLAWILPRKGQALFATIVVFLVAPMVIRYFISPEVNWDGGVRRVTLPRLDAIAYGVVLAYLKHHAGRVWQFLSRFWLVGVAGVVALAAHRCLYAMTGEGYATSFVFYRVFYFSVVSAVLMLIFPKVADLKAPGGWFELAVRKMSLWSYSIYLSHIFFSGLIAIGMSYFPWTRGKEPIIAFPWIWIFSLAGSALVYRYYEKPLMDLRDRPFGNWFGRKR